MTIKITSPAFSEGGAIPKKYTCAGENISPALSWSGLPDGTKSLALILDDPDAPSGIFTHWVLYDMPSSLSGLPEGVAAAPTVEGIGAQGTNSFRKTGYGGPCPPKGPAHHYNFYLYALDISTGLKPGASKNDLQKAMQGHILAQGRLIGTYAR